MLNHGGQLHIAQQRYPRAENDWLDLSTGIAPWSWPVPDVPESVWQRLPESDEALCAAARGFYVSEAEDTRWSDRELGSVALAGSQPAIESLPTLFASANVALPLWGYGEHAKHWQQADHRLHFYRDSDELLNWINTGRVTHVVVIRPNNPNGDCWPMDRLESVQQSLLSVGGWLIVDEAFADVHNHACQSQSVLKLMLEDRDANNLVVLRSIGKFFGMAGLRLGFAFAPLSLCDALRTCQPLWNLSHLAQWLGEKMLKDVTWQQQQRIRIAEGVKELRQQLDETLPSAWQSMLRNGPLFVSAFGSRSSLHHVHEYLAKQGIWTRFFEAQDRRSDLPADAGLRLGVPNAEGMVRLRQALESIDGFF